MSPEAYRLGRRRSIQFAALSTFSALEYFLQPPYVEVDKVVLRTGPAGCHQLALQEKAGPTLPSPHPPD